MYVLFYNESYSKIPELINNVSLLYSYLFVFICITDLLNGPCSTGVLLLLMFMCFLLPLLCVWLCALFVHCSCTVGLAEWTVPSGGMFVWVKLHVEDSHKMITVRAREKGVLFVPGSVFMMDPSKPSPYIRASYSNCTEEQMDTVSLVLTVRKLIPDSS